MSQFIILRAVQNILRTLVLCWITKMALLHKSSFPRISCKTMHDHNTNLWFAVAIILGTNKWWFDLCTCSRYLIFLNIHLWYVSRKTWKTVHSLASTMRSECNKFQMILMREFSRWKRIVKEMSFQFSSFQYWHQNSDCKLSPLHFNNAPCKVYLQADVNFLKQITSNHNLYHQSYKLINWSLPAYSSTDYKGKIL